MRLDPQGREDRVASDDNVDARVAKRRRDLMAKGMAVNGQLVALLAGKNATLLNMKLPHEQKPGMRKEERLRAFLDQIIGAQCRLGTPSYGHCEQCGVAFSDAALDEIPWLAVCAACAAKS